MTYTEEKMHKQIAEREKKLKEIKTDRRKHITKLILATIFAIVFWILTKYVWNFCCSIDSGLGGWIVFFLFGGLFSLYPAILLTIVSFVYFFSSEEGVKRFNMDINGVLEDIEHIKQEGEKEIEEEKRFEERMQLEEKKSKTCPKCGFYPVQIEYHTEVLDSITRMAEIVYKRNSFNLDEIASGNDIINIQNVPQSGQLIKRSHTITCPQCGAKHTYDDGTSESWSGPSRKEVRMGGFGFRSEF